MSKRAGALSAALTVMALAGAAMMSLGTSPAQAVVYCKTVGVPKGCVARPAAAVVVAPGGLDLLEHRHGRARLSMRSR